MSSTVRITDKNPEALRELGNRLKSTRRVRVGVQGSEASRPHGGKATVADIGAIHEFGLGNNPVRSWLRGWYDENESKIAEDIRNGFRKVIAGDISIDTLCEALGLRFVSGIQERISAGIAPPLSPETIARKESSTPLIDTNLFRSSITFVVESTGEMTGVTL